MNRFTGLIIVAAILSILILLMTPGCDTLVTEITNDTITLAGHPTAEFTADKEFGCAPCTVVFTDVSDGPRDRWTWDFGDGIIDTLSGRTPIHVYDSTGLFTVKLTIRDDSTGGTDAEEKKRFIVVGGSVADFTPNPDSGCAPLLVTFAPVEYGGIENWQWNFGDTTPISNLQFPVHTYHVPGVYQCTLVATGDSTCNDTIVVVKEIKVMGCPIAAIAVHDSADYIVDFRGIVGCIPFEVWLSDSSDPGQNGVFHPDSARNWDFGNGLSSTAADTSTTYGSAGTFWIKLEVRAVDAVGGNLWGGVDADSIKVTAYDSVTAGFRQLTAADGCASDLPFTVYFEDTSDGNIVSRLWDFGDPNNSASGVARVESHVYSDTGNYTVRLIVGAMCGDASDTIWDTTIVDSFVNIEPQPTAGFALDTTSGCAGLSVLFSNTSSDTISSPGWSWLINGAPAGSNRDTSFTFDTLGRYGVTLIARNGICVDSTTDTVFIGPLANFTADTLIGAGPLLVTFIDLSIEGLNYSWDFGDTASATNNSTLPNPTHTDDNPGTYTVRLLLSGCGSESNTFIWNDMIEVQ